MIIKCGPLVLTQVYCDHVTCEMAADPKRVGCPVCGAFFSKGTINSHVNECLNVLSTDVNSNAAIRHFDNELPNSKRMKTECDMSDNDRLTHIPVGSAASDKTKRCTSKQFASIFTSKSKSPKATTVKTTSIIGIPQPDSSIKSAEIKPALIEEKDSPGPGALPLTQPPAGDKPSSTVMTLTASKMKSSPIVLPLSDKVPLAEQVRPQTLEEYVGQDQAVGKNMQLRKLLDSNQIPSMIIWGPPGCGKTTLARIIAGQCKQSQDMRFTQLSATTSGIADVKEVIKVAKNESRMFKRKTILFVDEIHRFNKLQQDTFLPHVEDGTVVLIGATTENPSFQVNNALLSRCKVIVLEKLSIEGIALIVRNALRRLGLEVLRPKESADTNSLCITDEAVETLGFLCDGDARSALNSLQLLINARRSSGTPKKPISVEDIKEGLQRSHVQYDRTGEEHYNAASAFQKSIRGSSESGAIYWLARMLEGGEDALFIARRLVVCASEDIGLADPHALPLAVSTYQACHFLGMPECRINLAHCTTYLARAPKSNESYAALTKASESIKKHEGPLPGVPLHLRNASTKLMKNLGYGKGYKYSHAYSEPVQQEYLPQGLEGVDFFS